MPVDPEIAHRNRSEAGKRNIKIAQAARNKGHSMKRTVWMGKDLDGRLRAEAERQEKTISALVREIIVAYLGQIPARRGKGWNEREENTP